MSCTRARGPDHHQDLIGEPDRDGEILEAHGADGGPPYLVRWDDSDHGALLFPGSDAVVQELHPKKR